MRSRTFIYLFCVVSLMSCEEVIVWNGPQEKKEGLVIEAVLTDEMKPQEVRLTHLYGELNGNPEPISGAVVEVKSGNQTYTFLEESGVSGQYVSLVPFSIVVNETYELTVEYQSEIFSAFASGTESTPMRNFPLLPYQQTDSLYFANIGVEYHESEQSMYVFEIEWQDIDPGEKTRVKMVHYVFSTLNIGQLFGPDKKTIPFPKGSTIIQQKYALNAGFADYLRALVIESQWKGGLFEETAGNLPSNLSNGAFGYFAVCTVQRDTFLAR